MNQAQSPRIEAASLSVLPFKLAWSPNVMDFIEKMILVTVFTYFLVPVLGAVMSRGDIPSLMICISESLVILFVCIRRKAYSLSMRKTDWILALTATVTPMMVRPSNWSVLSSNSLPITLILIGMGIQIFGKISLGRRFGAVAANRGICCQGMYKWVRHPIYAGYLLTHIGFLLASSSWWNLGVYAFLYCLVVPRILAEERLLLEDHDYQEYCTKVRSRLIPGLF